MLYAVVRTGGKQYIVEERQVLTVEMLDAKKEEELSFDEVLLMVDDGKMSLGRPLVNGAAVKVKVLEHGKGNKVRGLKYKRGGKRIKFGHRQPYSKVEVVAIDRGA